MASKVYLETITWSFTEENENNKFKENYESIKIVNPISSELNVLRNSLFPNLIFYMEKNLNRGFGDQSLFEIGPVFTGKNPGQQITVVCGIKKQFLSDGNNLKSDELIDVFNIKKDLIMTLIELGVEKYEFSLEVSTPSYYHPGISGSIITKKDKILLGYFGALNPKITPDTFGFEIFLENLVNYRINNKKNKENLTFSDFQKSERDFAFLIDINKNAQELTEAIQSIDQTIIKNIKIFDVYEGKNIPAGKKSIALTVTIQSNSKTLDESDLTDISKKIVKVVEEKTGARLRS